MPCSHGVAFSSSSLVVRQRPLVLRSYLNRSTPKITLLLVGVEETTTCILQLCVSVSRLIVCFVWQLHV